MADMTKAEALRSLIGRAGAGEAWRLMESAVGDAAAAAGVDGVTLRECLSGSIDAMARLEAPLRERGWCGPRVTHHETGIVGTAWWSPEPESALLEREAPVSEARARLLAVLRALLHEAEAQ